MEKLLRVTNALLALIALCLVLLVAKQYRVDFGTTAYAAGSTSPQPVYLVYWDEFKTQKPVVGQAGVVPVWEKK